MFIILLISKGLELESKLELVTSAHAAAVWIVRRAGRNRKHAGPGYGDLIFCRGGRSLGGGNCSGESEDDDEGANELFHSGIPLKLYSQKKICLDKANEVTIGYIMK
jgi:hypothetical protein